jgi:hypothetical protein
VKNLFRTVFSRRVNPSAMGGCHGNLIVSCLRYILQFEKVYELTWRFIPIRAQESSLN